MRKGIALLAGLIVLVLINYSILVKENHIKEGQMVLLELAPVDPRSLMQGDYMALRFAVANELGQALSQTRGKGEKLQRDGYMVVLLDENKVGTFLRVDSGKVLSNNEVRMRYRFRNNKLQFATNAYFFEEGAAKVFEQARYGEFRVDNSSELLLVGMWDADFKKIKASKE